MQPRRMTDDERDRANDDAWCGQFTGDDIGTPEYDEYYGLPIERMEEEEDDDAINQALTENGYREYP